MKSEIEKTVKEFEKLLVEQLERQRRIEEQGQKRDFTDGRKIVIGLIDGDGIGPIIMDCARKTLFILLEEEIRSGKIELRDVNGLTIENRLALGESVPKKVMEEIKACDVILKGPTETPHGGGLESANVTLRRELDLFANVRPVRIPEKSVDWTFFRENSEGEYALGSRGLSPNDGMAIDFKVTTKEGSERIARAAFEFAAKNNKKSVTVVTKANIMKKTDGLFSEIAQRVGREYPQISVNERYVDIMTAELINEKTRSSFEVFLTPNLYGDILSDEAAQIQGGVGTAGSSNLGWRYAMFEAIHGTAPRLIEEGLGAYADPTSILRAAVLMLRHICLPLRASRLETAIDKLRSGSAVTGFGDGITCEEYAKRLSALL